MLKRIWLTILKKGGKAQQRMVSLVIKGTCFGGAFNRWGLIEPNFFPQVEQGEINFHMNSKLIDWDVHIILRFEGFARSCLFILISKKNYAYGGVQPMQTADLQTSSFLDIY